MKKQYFFDASNVQAVIVSTPTDFLEQQVYVYLNSGVAFMESGEAGQELLTRVKKERPDLFPKKGTPKK